MTVNFFSILLIVVKCFSPKRLRKKINKNFFGNLHKPDQNFCHIIKEIARQARPCQQ